MKKILFSILTLFLIISSSSFGQINTVINETFTDWPAPGWKTYQFGDIGTWHHGIGVSLGNERHARHNFNNPAGFQDNWLVSPPIQIASNNYKLIFDSYLGSGGIGGKVLISNASGVPNASGGTFVPIFASFPTNTSWSPPITVDLSPFAAVGQTIYIAFQVKTVAAPAFNTMLLIDNVIVGPPTSVNGTISVVSPIGYDQNAGNKNVVVNIKNSGTQPMTSYSINWKIDGVAQALYTGTTNINPGSSIDVTLGSYNFLSGIHTIDPTLVLTGDINPVDNTISSAYSVGVSDDIVLRDIWPKGSGKNTGSQPIIVNIYNHGSQTLSNFGVQWGINDSAKTTYTETVVSIAPGEAKNITVGSYIFSSTTKRYKIDAHLVLPSNLISSASDKSVFYNAESVFEDFNSSTPPNAWVSDTTGMGVMILDHAQPWDGNNISNWYYYGNGNDSTNSKSILWTPKLTIAAGDIIKVKGKSPGTLSQGKGNGRIVYRTGPGQAISIVSNLTWHGEWYTYTITVPSGAVGTMQIGLQSLQKDKDYIYSWDDFSTTAHYAYPILPGNLNIGSITGSSAVASWSASPAATSYNVRYRILGTTTWSAPMSTSSLFVSLTGLSSSKYYEVQASAVNANGSSEYCSSVIFLVPGTLPAPPIIGLVEQSSCYKSLTASITLNGLPSTGTWTIRMNPNGATTTGNGTTATFSGVVVGKYTFNVSNSSGISDTTPEVIIYPFDNGISAPNPGGAGTQPSCLVPTGNIILSGLPKTGTWTVTGIPGSITSSGSGPKDTISLPPGTYYFKVSQGLCTSDYSQGITLNAIPTAVSPPTVGTVTQPSCSNGGGSLRLSWTVSPVNSWTLKRYPDGAIHQSTGFYYDVSGIPPGTFYYTMIYQGCESVPSASFTINPVAGAPAPPILTVSSTCGVSQETVTFSGLPAGNWSILPGPGSPTTPVTGNTPSKSVLYSSGPKYFTVKDPATGCWSPPTFVTLTGAPTTPAKPTVFVTQPTCEVPSGQIVVGGLPSSGTWTLSPVGVTGTGQTVTFAGLDPGKYTYTVTKAGSGCPSPLSDTAVINAIPVRPATPNVGTITQPNDTVSTGSVVFSGLPSGNWVINPGSIVGSGTSTTISGVYPGTHNFTVTNGFCTSTPTGNVVIIPSIAAPVIGTIIHPTCTNNKGSVVLNGLPASGSWTINPGTITGSGINYTVQGLDPGPHTFTVSNSLGTSISSKTIIINAQPEIPTAPIVGTITHPSGIAGKGSVVLSGLPAGNWTINPIGVSGSTTNTTISNLDPGTYDLTVTNSVTCISPASTVVINIYTGINDVAVEGKTTIVVYPNPADEYFNFSINVKEEMILQVLIIDMLGKTIYSEDYKKIKQNKIVLDSSIPDGFYFFQVITSDGRYTQKFTKINK